jgi:ribonuclease P protein component
VYDQGQRWSSPLFAAFIWKAPQADGPRIGLTVPKALGPAVRRNRIKRRFREVLRRRMRLLAPHWWMVLNPRRTAAEAPLGELEREIERLIERCATR